MAKTAVGLFENSSSVDEVVRDLAASGFPQKLSLIHILGLASTAKLWLRRVMQNISFANKSKRVSSQEMTHETWNANALGSGIASSCG